MQTRDDIVAAARAVAERRGTHRLSRADFKRETGINLNVIRRLGGSWGEVCAAAGLDRLRWCHRYSDGYIFESMRDAFLASGGITSRSAMARHLPFHCRVLDRRFGSWRRTLIDFSSWIASHDPDFAHAAQLAARINALPEVKTKRPAIAPGPYWPSTGGAVCGEPVGYRGLMYAPLDENGVVLAFGMLAGELGFSVEKVSAKAFPDCIAKRRVGETRWERVRIEFEYRSRNFHDHGHDPHGCDLIVCWEHDWPGAPIEVLELRAAIARLAGN